MNFKFVLVISMLLSVNSMATEKLSIETVFDNYKLALQSYDTDKITRLIHPEELKRFRAAFDVALLGEKAHEAEKALLPLFSVTSVEKYSELSDRDVYVRMNEFVLKNQTSMVDSLRLSQIKLLNVSINDDLANVKYSLAMNIEGRDAHSEVIQKLKIHDGEWLLLLPHNAEATISKIKASF